MYFTTIQRAIYNFFLPDLVLLVFYPFTYLFPKKQFSLIFDFIKLLCTHDFSRVTFATELSTKLVYKSIFVIDYNYISINLLYSKVVYI